MAFDKAQQTSDCCYYFDYVCSDYAWLCDVMASVQGVWNFSWFCALLVSFFYREFVNTCWNNAGELGNWRGNNGFLGIDNRDNAGTIAFGGVAWSGCKFGCIIYFGSDIQLCFNEEGKK